MELKNIISSTATLGYSLTFSMANSMLVVELSKDNKQISQHVPYDYLNDMIKFNKLIDHLMTNLDKK